MEQSEELPPKRLRLNEISADASLIVTEKQRTVFTPIGTSEMEVQIINHNANDSARIETQSESSTASNSSATISEPTVSSQVNSSLNKSQAFDAHPRNSSEIPRIRLPRTYYTQIEKIYNDFGPFSYPRVESQPPLSSSDGPVVSALRKLILINDLSNEETRIVSSLSDINTTQFPTNATLDLNNSAPPGGVKVYLHDEINFCFPFLPQR